MGSRPESKAKLTAAEICALYVGGVPRHLLVLRSGLSDGRVQAVLIANKIPIRGPREAQRLCQQRVRDFYARHARGQL